MIRKNKIKQIHSLKQKKYRDELNLFIAEGPKTVGDLMHRKTPKLIVATHEWLERNHDKIKKECEVCEVSSEELSTVSLLKSPQQVLALFPIINNDEQQLSAEGLYIALDGVQDPGNLGTIIRIADWFGIKEIVCSHDTVDVYNPKVVQATMGSIARVNIRYVNLQDFIRNIKGKMPVYGTLLNGENIYEKSLTSNGIIVMGNEGNGISPEIRALIDSPLLIPTFQQSKDKADSLNVAVATAIVCSEFRRNV